LFAFVSFGFVRKLLYPQGVENISNDKLITADFFREKMHFAFLSGSFCWPFFGNVFFFFQSWRWNSLNKSTKLRKRKLHQQMIFLKI